MGGTSVDLKISKASWNIFRRISSNGISAWHGPNEPRDTVGLPFATLTRIDETPAATRWWRPDATWRVHGQYPEDATRKCSLLTIALPLFFTQMTLPSHEICRKRDTSLT